MIVDSPRKPISQTSPEEVFTVAPPLPLNVASMRPLVLSTFRPPERFTPLMPLLRWSFPAYVLTTEEIGLAMLRVVRLGAKERVLETRDIRAVLTSGKG